MIADSQSQGMTRTLFWAAIAGLVLNQLLGVFWGFELCDSGFYLTFYDHIYDAPDTVSYNFMYYLSGLLGGLVAKVLPAQCSMLLMRVAGVLVNLAIMLLLYRALRPHLGQKALLLGFALVIIGYFKPVYTLSYDLFTSLFYVVALTLLYRGLSRGTLKLVMAAGFVVGLNCFNRLPNVVALSLVVMVPLGCYYCRRSRAWLWRGVLLFVAGVAVAWGLVVAVMFALGHERLFLNNVKELFSIAQDQSGEQSHSMGQMIGTQVKFYGRALWAGVKIGVVVLLGVLADARLRRWWLKVLAWAVLAVPLVWFIYRMHPLEVVWAFSFVGCVAVLLKGAAETRLLAWLGLAMLLLFPLGSDGAYNNGAIIAWMAAPVAASVLCRHRVVVGFLCLFFAVVAVRTVKDGVYFDGGSLVEKTSTIENKHAQGVLTTPERKRIVDDLLTGIAPHVHEGDTLMAYGSLATINHLTGTRPYIGCSWPEQLSAAALERKLKEADGPLPWLLQQKFNTIADVWPEPSDTYLMEYGEETVYHRNSKLKVMAQFRQEHGYVAVFENSHFVLYAPAEKCR